MFHFGAAYYPEHRNRREWIGDLRLMWQAGLKVLRVGEFAWKRLEPAPGRYEFGWLEGFVVLAFKHGLQTLLCPPMRTAPVWLVESAPDMLIQTENGATLEFGSRYTFCINHPALRKHGLRLAERLARHFGDNPAV